MPDNRSRRFFGPVRAPAPGAARVFSVGASCPPAKAAGNGGYRQATNVVAFAFSGFIGVLFGNLRATRAAGVDPIDALRWGYTEEHR